MNRRRVVILGGAGAMGRITVQDFQRTAPDTFEVVVADRDPGAAATLGATPLVTDVNDPASLAAALDGAFAVIASLPYRFNIAAMRGALAARTHYIDLGGLFHVTREQLRLHGEFERAGCMAVLGMGSAPGILNILAERAARGLDRVDAIHCMVGASDRTEWLHASPLGFGYSPDTLLDEFAKPSAVFRDGEFRMLPALDPAERIAVRFPPPVGTLWLDTTLHSEVVMLAQSFASRGVREVTFRQSFEPEFLARLRFLVELGLVATEPLASGVVPRDVLLELLRRFPAPRPAGKPRRYEILRAQVSGRRGSRSVVVNADCHAGPDAGWGIGPDIDTGAPPGIAVQLLAAGTMPVRPGVWPCEQVVPVDAFVRELERRGMPVTVRNRRAAASRTHKRVAI